MNGGPMIAARHRIPAPSPLALSVRAHDVLVATAIRAVEIAQAEASRRGKPIQGFLEAVRHLEGIIDSPFMATGRAGPLTLDPDRRYTLRCVFAWAALEANPAVRLELRRFARLIGVTR